MSGDPKRRELASKDGSAAEVIDRKGGSTELNLRLWTHPPFQENRGWLSWKSDCIPIQMLSDLVVACNGILLPDVQDRLAAKFESPQQAVAAAKRIQWALLGFFQDQSTQKVGAAIVIAGEPCVISSLAVSKPAQILVAEAVYERLNGVPGMEFRNFGAAGGVHELVWALPDTYRLFEQALSQPLTSMPVPAEDYLSATRVLQFPATSVAFEPRSVSQRSALHGQVSEFSDAIQQPATDLSRPGTAPGKTGTTEAFTPSGNHSWTDFHSRRFRRALLVAGGVVAILAAALILIIVHKSAADRQTAKQQIETTKVAASESLVQPSLPVPRPPDQSITHTATAPPAAEPADKSATPDQPRGVETTDVSRGRKAQRERELRSAKTASTGTSDHPVEKGGKCQLLPDEISAYLAIADKNRAGGNYDDAAREYGAVIECDRHNARAREGLARTKQARAVSAPEDSQ